MTNEELVKLLQELSDGMICGKHVIELGQAAGRIEALTAENERLREALEPLANKGRLYLDALDVEKARTALEKQP